MLDRHGERRTFAEKNAYHLLQRVQEHVRERNR
jgi:hypothetical protein